MSDQTASVRAALPHLERRQDGIGRAGIAAESHSGLSSSLPSAQCTIMAPIHVNAAARPRVGPRAACSTWLLHWRPPARLPLAHTTDATSRPGA